MIPALVNQYRRGAIIADHLVVQCLQMIDPEHPELVLAGLPPEILDRMSSFVLRYIPGRMVTNYGLLPAADQVAAARRWLEAAATPVPDVTVPTESDWDKYQMESRILTFLGDTPSHPTGDVGRLFLTPYQIAIRFAEHFPRDTTRMGRPIGGEGAGNRSLAWYIAKELSHRIDSGKLANVEMRFVSTDLMKVLVFQAPHQTIVPTSIEAGHPLSVFRLLQEEVQASRRTFPESGRDEIDAWGRAESFSIELPQQVQSGIAASPEAFAAELRLAAAIEWYRQGRVSQGRGAEIAGLSRIEFLDALFQAKVPACQVTVDELMEEVNRARASDRERVAPDPADKGGAP